MFLEPQTVQDKQGWIEVICGSMFSGKTEELIRRLKRAQFAGQKVDIFKPQIDTRYSQEAVVSHNQNQIESIPVAHSSELLLLANGADVIGIDEAQFFDEGIVDVVTELANRGMRIIIAGLDMDYTGKPFGQMPELLARAEYVTKLHAICMDCGSLASHSHRISNDNGQLALGEKNKYEPLCRRCYNKKNKANRNDELTPRDATH